MQELPPPHSESEENSIPFQYRGLSKEVVEELWIPKIYIDPEKNESERIRRDRVLKQIEEQEKANELRSELGIPLKEDSEKLFGEFKVKNGETDIGAYWYEYSNLAAKQLKESGKLEWGKERIYFDIPFDKMEEMRDIAFRIAKENNIPISFKHLDLQKSYPVQINDKEITRFVTNFASADDAKRFYEAISQIAEYNNIKSDRSLDHHGYNIDGVAHYASGYREQRMPLENIIKTAKQNLDGTYTYTSAYEKNGQKQSITIPQETYEKFLKQYESFDPQKAWEEAGKIKQ
ncbi:MAG: hypothetical protein M3Q63_00220 [bacterium]|nr:hypothetical protein [bacterium]